jgi:DNA-binding MarR family transcriptional regulator
MNDGQDDIFFETCGLRVLMALRRMIRAVDIYSRKLNNEFKITVPQLICLYSIGQEDGMILSTLAKQVNLGVSTVNGIVDRLEDKGLLKRTRSEKDRRRVLLNITQQGRDVAKSAPALLQDRLAVSLRQLPDLEQAAIALSLERVVELMEAEHLETSPNLIPGINIGENQAEGVQV